MKLQHKTAIVTGGGTGIGKAIALAFAEEGASIAICGKKIDQLEKVSSLLGNVGEKVLYGSCDITSPNDIAHFIKEVLERFGTIDILVNNAGVASSGNILTTTEEEWNHVLATDLTGIFRMSKTVIPHMVSQSKGKIINIASIAGIVGFSQSAAYVAAKGAVINLTREMALDFAKDNITVNSIAPGIIKTDMTKEIQENDAIRKSFLERIPLGRFGTPEDIAHVAVFLASEDADYITGQTIVADGGWTIQ